MRIEELELYRNDDIIIDFKLPAPVKELMKLLDTLYEAGEDLKYNLYTDILHSYCKSMLDAKTITHGQFEKLLDRYGAW